MPMNDVKSSAIFLARLGKIKLGLMVPNKSGNGMHPEATPFFQFRDAPAFQTYYGEDAKVDALQIHFPFVDFDRNIEGFHRLWAGGGGKKGGVNICKGDGDKVLSALPFRVEEKKGRIHVYRAPGDRLVDQGVALCSFRWNGREFSSGDTVPCSGIRHNLYPQCRSCGPATVLRVMIREPEKLRQYGYYQIATKSLGNYRHFLAVWNQITDDGANVVPMNAIPFLLRIMPQSTVYQDPKSKMWQAGENFFLRLLVDVDTLKLMASARAQRFDRLLMASTAPVEPIFTAPEEPPPTESTDQLEASDLESAPPVQEGEYTEAAPLPEQNTESEPEGNGNGNRPYDADGVIDKLNSITQQIKNDQHAVTDNDMAPWLSIAYEKIQECFACEGAGAMADLTIYAIFKTMSSDLTIGQVTALVSWLLESKTPDSGGAYILHPYAAPEVRAVYDMAMLTGLEIPPF